MLKFDQMKQEIRSFLAKFGILADRLRKPLRYVRIVVLIVLSAFLIVSSVRLLSPFFEESETDRFEHYNPYDLGEIAAGNHQKSEFITSEALDSYANGDEKWGIEQMKIVVNKDTGWWPGYYVLGMMMIEQEEWLQTITLNLKAVELNVKNDTIVFGGVDTCSNEGAKRQVDYARRQLAYRYKLNKVK